MVFGGLYWNPRQFGKRLSGAFALQDIECVALRLWLPTCGPMLRSRFDEGTCREMPVSQNDGYHIGGPQITTVVFWGLYGGGGGGGGHTIL